MFDFLTTIHLDQASAFLLDWGVKAFVILTVAVGVTALLRKHSAALRHMVWTISVLLTIALPLFSTLLPSLNVALPERTAQTQPQRAETVPSVSRAIRSLPVAARRSEESSVAPVKTAKNIASRNVASQDVQPAGMSKADAPNLVAAAPKSNPIHWPTWLLAGWAAGVVIMALPLLIATIGLWWASHKVRRFPNPALLTELETLCEDLGVRQTVALRQTNRSLIPITWGLLRPVLLLPSEAGAWTAQQRRTALLHELAHIKRRDCLVQFVAQLLRAAHWFNPLAWWAAHRLRIERERACDDLVLRAGLKATDYAEHLVDIVRTLRSERCSSLAAVAIAQPGGLETRVRAILDDQRNRRRLTRRVAAALLCLGLIVALPLAALKAGEKKATPAENVSQTKADKSSSQEKHQRRKLLDKQTRKDVAKIDHMFASYFRSSSRYKLASPAKKKAMVQKWIEQARGDDFKKRTRAIAALGNAKAQAAVETLIEIAEEPMRNNRPKWLAVRGLGEIGDVQAVPTLIGLVDHGNWNTRVYARAALAQITGVYLGEDKDKWAQWWKENAPKTQPLRPPGGRRSRAGMLPGMRLPMGMPSKENAPKETVEEPSDTSPKVQQAFVPDADTKDMSIVLDLVSGKMLPNFPKDQGIAYYTKLGKGDLAYDNQVLICLRGAKAMLVKNGKVIDIVPQVYAGVTGYRLGEKDDQFIIETAEKRRFFVEILGYENGGIQIQYSPKGKYVSAETIEKGPAAKISTSPLPPDVMTKIAAVHVGTYPKAQPKGLRTNTHIYVVDEKFRMRNGGLMSYWNETDKPVPGPIRLGNFGRKKPDYLLLDEQGKEQTYELRDRPMAKYGKYSLWWKPSQPVQAGAIRTLAYFHRKPRQLRIANGQAMLTMVNNFGSPVLENFFLVVPMSIKLVSWQKFPTNRSHVGNNQLILWQREIPANTKNQVNVVLTKGQHPKEHPLPAMRPVGRGLGAGRMPGAMAMPTPSEAGKREAETLAVEGWKLWGKRKLPEAKKKFKAAVAKDPSNTKAWNGLGWSQFNQGKPFNAKLSFEKCIALDPKHPAALNGLGWIAKGQGKTDQAIGYWEKAVKATPDATAALTGLAQTYMERKQYKQAVKYYEMWLKVEPKNADAKKGLEKAKDASQGRLLK